MATYDAVEVKPPKPAWATDPNASIPLGFVPANGIDPDKFWLGEKGRRAVVLLDATWREENGEAWVGVAAGCWKALCDEDCSREMAELIAKGWITAAGGFAAAVVEHAKRLIIVPNQSNAVH